MTPSHLLYLHGFRSSPQSTKARKLAAWLGVHAPRLQWWCPQLPASPREAMTQVFARLDAWQAEARQRGTAPHEAIAVIGSSLGGFYASVVAERLGCRAVLLNPAVDPARDLARHIGETRAWHDPSERLFFRADYIDELRALAVPALTPPERYLAIIAKGDEVLDWREMTARCAGAHIELLEGGDHALSDFDAHLPCVMRFLELAPA